MNEKALKVLEQYDLDIVDTYRSRGNYGCNTLNKKFILQEYKNSNDRIDTLTTVSLYLEKGGIKTDYAIKNREDTYVSLSEDGMSYILKRWYPFDECNINSTNDIEKATIQLGRFHLMLEDSKKLLEDKKKLHKGKNALIFFEKHNRE